jgi:hypothetical protein
MKIGDFQIFSEANLETGLKGGCVGMLQRNIGLKTAGPAYFEVE